jgi:three-Cys-motif partner protein
MARASYRVAEDGFPARDADTWTEEKLMILECYLHGFAHACRKAGGWYALDLFAGTGLNYSLTRSAEILGSPLIALEAGTPQATRLIAAETDERAREALISRCGPYGERSEICPDDANTAVERILKMVPKQAPAFAFLDPEGSELDWRTVAAIAAHKQDRPNKVEQLILFPTDMGFVRLAPDYPDKVTRIFGHDQWLSIFEARRAGKISADEARGQYVRMYADGLRGLGYGTVLDRQIATQSGQPMYFLIYATDHDAGQRIMDHCFDAVKLRVVEELGQATLFPAASTPRRRRLDADKSSEPT